MKAEQLLKLREPFAPEDIEWRLQSCGEKNGKFWGKCLAYITSRAVQDRLDEVCGTDGWQISVRKEGEAYLATLSIRVEHEDGIIEWISRTDGADSTDIEAVKGGISGAIKRCAVLFGVGRYLYNLKDNWVVVSEDGTFSGKTKDGKWFNWNPPKLPSWALPAGTKNVEPKKETKPKEEAKDTSPLGAMNDVDKIVVELNKYSFLIPADKTDKINQEIKNKNYAYLKSILDWCIGEDKRLKKEIA